MISARTGSLAHQAALALGAVLLAAVCALCLVPPAAAQVTSASSFQPLDGEDGQGGLPNRLAGQVGIIEKLGSSVDQGLTFVDESGADVKLGSVFGHDKPVALVFAYHNCPMLCSLVLDGVAEAVTSSDLRAGTDYDVVVVSIDPKDGSQRASEVKAKYVNQIGDPAVAAGLHFWTVTADSEDQVQKLAESVGFRYAYDVRTGEYAHHATLMMLSPQGVVTRYLYGIDFPQRDFRLALVEAGEGTIGTSIDRFLLTCFEYDEDAQSYSLAIMGLLKISGGLMLVLFVAGLGYFWRREVSQQGGSLPPAATGSEPAPVS